MKPNKFQQKIYEHVAKHDKRNPEHILVGAVAGSGKTTTLLGALKSIPEDEKVLLLAFNRHIMEELSDRLKRDKALRRGKGAKGSIKVSTVYSAGAAALQREFRGRMDTNRSKYRNIIKHEKKNLEALTDGSIKLNAKLQYFLSEAVDYARLSMVDTSNADELKGLIKTYALDAEVRLSNEFVETHLGLLIEHVVNCGKDLAKTRHVVDFTDMIYLPAALELEMHQHDRVFVDEAQDLSRAQLWIARNSCKPDGQMVFVGDECQAVYGFAGAQSNSIQQIREVVGAKDLPLSICYRCPKSHISLAAHIRPDIKARPRAPQGVLEVLKADAAGRKMKSGDLVLCRTVAPLVSTALDLISKGKKAKLLGVDTSKEVIAALDSLVDVAGDNKIHESQLAVMQWLAMEKKDLTKSNPDADTSDAEDIAQCLLSVLQAYGARGNYRRSIGESKFNLVGFIKNLFSPDASTGITLASIHKAKGLEAKRVFLMRPLSFPNINARQDWEIEQEKNLLYVALTRSLNELYLVSDTLHEELQGQDLNEPAVKATVLGEALLRKFHEIENRTSETSSSA